MCNQNTPGSSLTPPRCPAPPRCAACAQVMRLARRTARYGRLPDLLVFECRACGVSNIEEA